MVARFNPLLLNQRFAFRASFDVGFHDGRGLGDADVNEMLYASFTAAAIDSRAD